MVPTSYLLALLLGTAVASPFKRGLRRRHNESPSVDLGYEIHTSTTNSSGDYYIFSNIPYAEQPVDDLRFHVVGLPTANSSTVNNGSTDVICMQAAPEWILAIEAEEYGVSTEVVEELLYSESGQTEACLKLDVYVPANVFDGNATSTAPVLIWVHGGGFTSGSKTSAGDPAGIIARSTLNGSEGVIFVSINYRLGLFGWLGGGGITPNLGLYDQRVAFDWVQKYIGLFGGDPDQVTVIGESAGAASILHQITSYGGAGSNSFSQAVVQSPAFQLNMNLTDAYEKTLAEASNLTGQSITDATQLAALDSATLQAINFDVVLGADQGLFVYGPAPDGTLVPALPQILLSEGRFDSDVRVMSGHNSLEAAPFVGSNITTEADLIAALRVNYPEASNATLTYILDVLYPSQNYASQFLRGVQITSDSEFSCATRYLAEATGCDDSYNYLFAYPPGYHGEDVSYTFFDGDTTTTDDGYPVNAGLAHALQDYIVGFAVSGDPNGSPAGAAVEFPVYGTGAAVVEFAADGVLVTTDDLVNEPCEWWLQAMIEGLV